MTSRALRVLVTAGGTREAIDAVRFIGNRSSGKMGHAVARQAALRGAVVTLVTTVPLAVEAGIDVVPVTTAAEMADAVHARFDATDAVVMAAAVADFRPKAPAPGKLKKSAGPPEIVLEPTPDILAELGARKAGQVLVGLRGRDRARAGARRGEAPGEAGRPARRQRRVRAGCRFRSRHEPSDPA